MRYITICSGLITALLLSFCVDMTPSYAKASVEVNQWTIRINDKNYRRRGAEEASLGAFGTKDDVAHPIFNRQMNWDADPMEIQQPTVIELKTDQQKELDVSAAVQMDDIGVEGGGSGGSKIDAKYKLMKLSFVSNKDVIDALNASDMLGFIKYTKNPRSHRIITEVWILLHGTETQITNFSASFKGSNGKYSAKSNYDRNTEATFSFSEGTVMAYSFSRITWNSNRTKKKEKITSIDLDQYRRL